MMRQDDMLQLNELPIREFEKTEQYKTRPPRIREENSPRRLFPQRVNAPVQHPDQKGSSNRKSEFRNAGKIDFLI